MTGVPIRPCEMIETETGEMCTRSGAPQMAVIHQSLGEAKEGAIFRAFGDSMALQMP